MRKCVGLNDKGHLVATIPAMDLKRASLFSDPVKGKLKHVDIYRDYRLWKTLDHSQTLDIPLFNRLPRSVNNAADLLYSVHVSTDFRFGFLTDEFSEQMMIARFLPHDAKVLELGTNTGRTAMIISSILDDDSQFVTMETNREWSICAETNRNANNKHFTVINGTISHQPLYQKNMCCVSEAEEGCPPVPVFTLDEFRKQYPVAFDTLVADCEGGLHPILLHFPSLLDGIQLIIMENDYSTMQQKREVDAILDKNNFHCVYREIFVGNDHPCNECFYEVWQRFSTI